MRKMTCLLALFISISLFASERVNIWPKDKMPHRQDHQIAAMTDEARQKDFKADKNRVAYLEWYDAPAEEVRNGGCMILISGGGYESCCDMELIKLWN
ncbi:MAG TPA: alpha/beta hydrolase, partial [Porphyromonadaceae bacterium]|nr:alpha/beta hydrolase [Porphyromonadaceae bacterium]